MNKTTDKAPSQRSGFGRIMLGLDRGMSWAENIISVGFLIIMTVAVLAGVAMRYLLAIPNPYGEEISRYSMIVVAFIGVSMGVRQGAHLGITSLVDNVPIWLGNILRFVQRLIVTGAYAFFAYQSYGFVLKTMKYNQTSPSMRIQMWVIYSVLAIGFLLSFIRMLLMLWNWYLAKDSDKLPEESDDDVELNFQ